VDLGIWVLENIGYGKKYLSFFPFFCLSLPIVAGGFPYIKIMSLNVLAEGSLLYLSMVSLCSAHRNKNKNFVVKTWINPPPTLLQIARNRQLVFYKRFFPDYWEQNIQKSRFLCFLHFSATVLCSFFSIPEVLFLSVLLFLY
jgi:hypothetical protein